MLARIDFLVNIALVFLVGLLIYGGSFAWLAVFMRLHGRLSVVTDVFLFLVYLWVVAYLKNTLVVAAAQVSGPRHGLAVAGTEHSRGLSQAIISPVHFLFSSPLHSQMCGAWYYRHLDVKHPMWEGWHRATSINAGSVALGSMFSGISRFLQVVAGFLRTRVSARMQVRDRLIAMGPRL